MPALSDIKDPIKAIIAADSGTGKTGALWSLAAAGFKLKIFDSDKGTPILHSIMKKAAPGAIKNIEVNSFTNVMTLDPTSGFMKPKGTPKAWTGMLNALNKWPDSPDKGIQDWGPDTVAVFDSLTLFGRHALISAQHLEGKGRWKPELQHYGTAMAQIEALFAANYGDNVTCHILYLTHIKAEYAKPESANDDPEFLGAYPSSLGKSLNGVIPRYVNDILTIKMNGSGPTAKRLLSTKPTQNRMATKTRDLLPKHEYLLADGAEPKPGLAEFFADCGWSGPK